MSELVLNEIHGEIVTLTINRPDKGNLVTVSMGAELADRLLSVPDDAKLVLLRGAGDDFCVGRDPGSPPSTKPSAQAIRAAVTEPALGFYDAFRRCPAPIIGVVQGRALGMGCGLAALCDITIAADDARFKAPEMDRDLPPTLLMSALLGCVGPKAVANLIYSRDEIDAATALQIGLISRIAPANELEAAVDALVGKLSENSAASLRAVKEYLRSAPGMDRQGASDFASNLLASVLASQ